MCNRNSPQGATVSHSATLHALEMATLIFARRILEAKRRSTRTPTGRPLGTFRTSAKVRLGVLLPEVAAVADAVATTRGKKLPDHYTVIGKTAQMSAA